MRSALIGLLMISIPAAAQAEDRQAALDTRAAAIRQPIDEAGGYQAVGQRLKPWREALVKRLADAPKAKPGQPFIGHDQPMDGGDGWLISARRAKQLLYESDFEGDFPEIDARYAAAERALVRAHRELEAQGIRLIVALSPDKSDIYPERIAPLPEGVPTVSLKSKQLYQRLLRAGVEVVDLEPALLAAKDQAAGPLYMWRDTHWSPAGARVAAHAVAERIGVAEAGESPFIERPNVKLKWHGDLAKNWSRAGKRDKNTHEETHRFVGVGQRGGGDVKPDGKAGLLVMGDSFSTFPYGSALGFWQFLAQRTGQPARFEDQAGGGHTVLKKFARLPEHKRQHVKTLVLVFINCTVYEVDLPEVPLLKTPLPIEPMRSVRVTLLDNAPEIDPKSAAYEHATAGFRAAADRGDGFPIEMVVYAPAMRDRELLPAAKWKAGDTLTLDLLPEPAKKRKGEKVLEGDIDPAWPVGYVVLPDEAG